MRHLHVSIGIIIGAALLVGLLGQPLQPTAAAPAHSINTAANTLNLAGGGYINVPNAPALNPSDGLTVEAWVRRLDTSGACQTIVGKDYRTGFWLGICNNRLRFYSNGIGSLFDGSRAFVAGEWTHVAASFDGTTRRLYINGNLDAQSVRVSPLPVNTRPLRIGADVSDGFSEYRFTGNLADVRLWGVVRSSTEIRRDMVRLFEARRPVLDDELIAAWHLEGTPADIFGNHNGTPVGTLSFNGPAAPPTVHDPIRAPRLGSPPAVDGHCRPGEYGSGALRKQGAQWVLARHPDGAVAARANASVSSSTNGPGRSEEKSST